MISLCSKDGSGNTRLILSVHLDYLRLIMNFDTYELLTQACQFGMGSSYVSEPRPWSAGKGAKVYDNAIVSPLGVQGGWSYSEENKLYQMVLDFKGEYFESKSNVDSWRLVRGYYYTYHADCSRIDIAIDDPTYSIIPVDDIVEQAALKNMFGPRKFDMRMSEPKISSTSNKDSRSSTIVNTQTWLLNKKTIKLNLDLTAYLGSRNSGQFIRIYDHDYECLRFEVEYKRKHSRQIFEKIAKTNWGDKYRFDSDLNDWKCELINCTDANNVSNADMRGTKEDHEIELSKLMGGIAVSSVDFRDKSVLKNRAKASIRDTPRFYWWDEFIDNVGYYLKVKLPKQRIKTIERSIAWVHRQVAPTLAMLRKCMDTKTYQQFYADLMLQGESRLTDYQLLLINEYLGFS